MTKILSIRQGPYAGQNLQLEDDVAASALADNWAVDMGAEGYDPHNSPNVSSSEPYPQSLTDFLATIASGEVSGGGGGGEPPAPKPAPVVDELIPATAVLDDPDFTLRVLGSGFTNQSKIIFADQPEPIVFISDEEITTVVKPSLGWGAVTVPVLVRNADGKESGTLDFEFTEV